MRYQVQAHIFYEEVRHLGAGIYVWVTPDDRSCVHLKKLLVGCPFDTYNSTEWHTTVLHCKLSELPEDIGVPVDRAIKGLLRELVVWKDHKERDIVVALIDSPMLDQVNQELQDAGLPHSHPEFNAHISIAKDIPMNAQTRVWLTAVNEGLRDNPLIITFDPVLRAVSCD